MWQMIKDDPLLKTITVIILGVLGFGFAFNIMFGQSSGGSMGHNSEMAGGRYSLDSTLSYFLILAIKLLLIAAVVIAIVAIVKLAKKYIFKGEEVEIMNTIKNDPVIKTVVVVLLSIIGLFLVMSILAGVLGVGNMSNGYIMNGYGMMGFGAQSLSLAGILTVLLKILLFVSIVGLLAGIGVILYQKYGNNITINKVIKSKDGITNTICGNCNQTISDEYAFCPACGAKTKQPCESCGAELKMDWNCCPNCGKEK